jgi:hypothetical protein
MLNHVGKAFLTISLSKQLYEKNETCFTFISCANDKYG